MNQNRRTKVLGGILLLILAAGAGRSWFLQPLRDARQKLEDARHDQAAAQDQDFLLQAARARIHSAMAASLPPSINDAQRLYLEWVTSLALENGFTECVVTPGRRDSRSGKYHLVSVVVNAESGLEDLCRFLFLFRQADVLHRVTALEIQSIGAADRPRMRFRLTAEGMSITGVDERVELVAGSELRKPVSHRATRISVENVAGFPPEPPFLIRAEREILKVTGITEDGWIVERGCVFGRSEKHDAGARIFHFPVAPGREDRQFAVYREFLEKSLFVRPFGKRRGRIRLAGLKDLTCAPGDTLTLTAHVDRPKAETGPVLFAVEGRPDGMMVDSRSGDIYWRVPDDHPPGKRLVTVVASTGSRPELLRQDVIITIRPPNHAPEPELPSQVTVFAGRPFRLFLKARDDGDADHLRWSLGDGSIPDGLAVDSRTGELHWDSPVAVAAGTWTVQVEVTDRGDPPKTSSGMLTLEVKEDEARLLRLTSILTRNGVPEAWFRHATSGEERTLHAGDRLQVADIDAKIIDIQARLVAMRDNDGFWLLALGNTVRDRVPDPERTQSETQPAD